MAGLWCQARPTADLIRRRYGLCDMGLCAVLRRGSEVREVREVGRVPGTEGDCNTHWETGQTSTNWGLESSDLLDCLKKRCFAESCSLVDMFSDVSKERIS
jgi:hypothetical protein